MVALRESIRREFPAEQYRGKITPVDDNLEDPDLDEEKALYDALTGKAWTELSAQLITQQPDGYLLLTDDAFPAFLPAWLMHSLEPLNDDNEVREFVVYSFSSTMRQFRVLNPEQQRTGRSLLVEFTERGISKYERELAAEAIALIDRRRY
jgi:hypothetical protein